MHPIPKWQDSNPVPSLVLPVVFEALLLNGVDDRLGEDHSCQKTDIKTPELSNIYGLQERVISLNKNRSEWQKTAPYSRQRRILHAYYSIVIKSHPCHVIHIHKILTMTHR